MIYFIGVDGEQVVDSKETAKQIETVKFLKDVFGMPEEFTRPIIEEIHEQRP